MKIWTMEKWKRKLPASLARAQSRVDVYADKGVEAELEKACAQFIDWLRHEYRFPIPICVYLKNEAILRTMDGDTAVGTFFEPPSYTGTPAIRVAAGDYGELVLSDGRDDAAAAILTVIAHEMTHYFQWINGMHFPGFALEWQAFRCARRILAEYAETRDHP